MELGGHGLSKVEVGEGGGRCRWVGGDGERWRKVKWCKVWIVGGVDEWR